MLCVVQCFFFLLGTLTLTKTMRSHSRLCHFAFSPRWHESKQRCLALVAHPGSIRETLTTGPNGAMFFFPTQRLKTQGDWRALDWRRCLLTHDLEPTCQSWRAQPSTLPSPLCSWCFANKSSMLMQLLFVNWIRRGVRNQNHLCCFCLSGKIFISFS